MTRDYFELTKPRLTVMALLTTLLGFVTGSAGRPDWALMAHAFFGSALAGGGANALNQYLERDIDARMRRTEKRPIPSGRVGAREALVFGVALSVAGVAHLYFFVNALTAGLGALTILSYVGVYTPLKSRTHWNTFVGAVPGALPAMMGWAAATDRVGVEAWVLFTILFFWQLPHFYSIAWMYREDYASGGLRMITEHEKVGYRLGWQIVFYSLVLIPASLAPVYVGMAGQVYFFTAFTAGALFVTFAFGMVIYRMAPARRFMAASIVYLSTLIVVMIADRV